MLTKFNPVIFDYKLCMESSAFKSGLFEELKEAIGKLRASDTFTTDSIKESGIMQLIKDRTNMSINFMVAPNYSEAAYVTWPSIDKNHPFVDNQIRKHIHQDTGLTLIRALGGSMTGSVDVRNCRVGGIFEKLEADIVIGEGLLVSKRYNDGEITAIVLHEIGHYWTYFVYLGSVVTASHVISATTKAVYEIEDLEERKIVLSEAEKVLGVEIANKERIAIMPKQVRGLATESVLVSAKAMQSQSETGYNIYELRSVEQLADRFAVQHGAGPDLATALDKIVRARGHQATMSTAEHVFFETCKLTMFTAGLFLFPVPLLIAVLTTSPLEKYYDDPEKRIRLIKQMIVDELKDDRLTPARRKQLQDDYTLANTVEEGLDDKRTLLELFHSTIMPSGRRAMKQEESQKRIEDLMNNELFVISNRFKIGA